MSLFAVIVLYVAYYAIKV